MRRLIPSASVALPDDRGDYWHRVLLLGVLILAAILLVWELSDNGYANTYYTLAVYAGSKSWSALFFNALDTSRYVTIDKTPLSIWMMAISARVLGFNSFSMLLPNALCGVGTVFVLHDTVRRTVGRSAAIIAALILALTPAVVAVSRFNNPDALLMLLLVCSAWALVRGLESGRTRHLVLCGVLVGLAFNTKMLQAFLVLPALAATFMLAGSGDLRRRIYQLAVAGCALIMTSAAWITIVMLVPAHDRPFVGDTTTNSWFDLIFGANGVARIGNTAAPDGGITRLFNGQTGGQIAWLLPLGAVSVATGLWLYRRRKRTDTERASYVLWGVWLTTHVVVFSVGINLFHAYYTSALAPAVAALSGAGLVSLWRLGSRMKHAAVALGVVVIASATLSFVLLARVPEFLPWLRWVVLASGVTAAALAIVIGPGRSRSVAALAVSLGLVSLLAGPAAYSVATDTRQLSGSSPVGGPINASGGNPPVSQLDPKLRLTSARLSSVRLDAESAVYAKLIQYLVTHQHRTHYLVAVTGSRAAAWIALASRRPIITMGGFAGSDPVPRIGQLKQLIRSGQVRYVLLGRVRNVGALGLGGDRARAKWVIPRCKQVHYWNRGLGSGRVLYDCAGAA